MIQLILGVVISVFGVFTIIKGKLPLIRNLVK